MSIRLEIERLSGIDERAVTSDGFVTGKCPGCSVAPFKIVTHPPQDHDGGERSGARCVACNDPVGWVYVTPDTIFGAEEDERVLNGRPRVY